MANSRTTGSSSTTSTTGPLAAAPKGRTVISRTTSASLQPALAVLEILEVGQPAAGRLADTALRTTIAMGDEVGMVAVIQAGRQGVDPGGDEWRALLVQHPDILDLGQGRDQPRQPLMDPQLVRLDRCVADDPRASQ